MVARHAGYRPLELNASDDRSAKVIRERITAAQDSRDVLGNARPALVILDEVDGMDGGPHGGVTELVKLIKATPPFKAPPRPGYNGGAGQGAGAGTRKGGEGDGDGDGGGAGADSDEDGDNSGAAASGAGKAALAHAGKAKAKAKAPHGGAGAGAGDDDAGGDGDGGAGSAAPSHAHLRAPIICICNDQYAPALRELRPLAFIVELGRANPDRLIARLKHVSGEEGIPLAPDALPALAAVTDHDVRSCLNTLHFLKYAQVQSLGQASKNGGAPPSAASLAVLASLGRRITAEMVTRAAVGLKDQSQAVFDLWTDVFRSAQSPAKTLSPAFARHSMALRMRNRGASAGGTSAAGATSSSLLGAAAAGSAAAALASLSPDAAASAYAAYLYDAMAAYSSEPRLLFSGLHENLLTASRVDDPGLTRVSSALDWLCFGEHIAARAMSGSGGGGADGLLKYIAIAGLGVHQAMASPLPPGRLAWPRADANMRRRQEGRRHALDSLLAERAAAPGGMLPVAGAMDRSALVVDILSPLVSLLSPRLRPVLPSLYNSREKRAATVLVELLAAWGLTYAPRPEQRYGYGYGDRFGDRERGGRFGDRNGSGGDGGAKGAGGSGGSDGLSSLYDFKFVLKP